MRMRVRNERRGVIVVAAEAGLAPGCRWLRADERDHAGDDGAEKRQEDDGFVHAAQPFIRLTSSTAIEPRLRK